MVSFKDPARGIVQLLRPFLGGLTRDQHSDLTGWTANVASIEKAPPWMLAGQP